MDRVSPGAGGSDHAVRDREGFWSCTLGRPGRGRIDLPLRSRGWPYWVVGLRSSAVGANGLSRGRLNLRADSGRLLGHETGKRCLAMAFLLDLFERVRSAVGPRICGAQTDPRCRGSGFGLLGWRWGPLCGKVTRPSQAQGAFLRAGMWRFRWGVGLGQGQALLNAAGPGGQIRSERRVDRDDLCGAGVM